MPYKVGDKIIIKSAEEIKKYVMLDLETNMFLKEIVVFSTQICLGIVIKF